MDRRFTCFSVLVLIATGCQQNPYVSSHLEILGAERRALEDRVLNLEFELERAEKRLEEYRDGGSTGSTSRNSRPAARPSRDTGPPGEDGPLLTPDIQIPDVDDGLPPTLEPPRVNEGRPTEGPLPNPEGDSAAASPRYRKPTRPIAVTKRAPGDPRITRIELNPALTGGIDIDKKSGDDGLIVVFEPRNADNEFVPLAGPVTVVLLDYAKRDQGTAAQVARWDIDAPTVHKSIVNDEFSQGIQLRLPWTEQFPEHSKLRLDVRYTTADGRQLDARADVYVTLPGQFSTRWTPRSQNSGNDPDASPNNPQAPATIARQPDGNESAATRQLPTVTQSAFTTVRPAAAVDTSESTSPAGAADPPRPGSRPTWQPNR